MLLRLHTVLQKCFCAYTRCLENTSFVRAHKRCLENASTLTNGFERTRFCLRTVSRERVRATCSIYFGPEWSHCKLRFEKLDLLPKNNICILDNQKIWWCERYNLVTKTFDPFKFCKFFIFPTKKRQSLFLASIFVSNGRDFERISQLRSFIKYSKLSIEPRG